MNEWQLIFLQRKANRLARQRGQVPGLYIRRPPCADEARTLGLAVEALDGGEEKDRRTVGGDRLSSI
jgi:hypothetical protein